MIVVTVVAVSTFADTVGSFRIYTKKPVAGVYGATLAAATPSPSVPTVRLANGVDMPLLTLGTPNCPFTEPDACRADVATEVLTIDIQTRECGQPDLDVRVQTRPFPEIGLSSSWCMVPQQ